MTKRPKLTYALTGHEAQSGHTRVDHAESLITQLPKDHEGRNTWLMNYGKSEEAEYLRTREGLTYNERTHAAETKQ